MQNLINTSSFKKFVENLGIGSKFVLADIIDNKIHVTCLAKCQNVILFKFIFSFDNEVEIVNGYNLYNKTEIQNKWKSFISNYLDVDLTL